MIQAASLYPVSISLAPFPLHQFPLCRFPCVVSHELFTLCQSPLCRFPMNLFPLYRFPYTSFPCIISPASVLRCLPCVNILCAVSPASVSLASFPRKFQKFSPFGPSLVPRPYRGSQITQYVTAILAKTKSILTM